MRGARKDSRLYAQLVLDLEDARKPVAWEGRSPRALTRGHKLLFLSQEAQKNGRFSVDPEQIDMFLEAKAGPQKYSGAPLLLPF